MASSSSNQPMMGATGQLHPGRSMLHQLADSSDSELSAMDSDDETFLNELNMDQSTDAVGKVTGRIEMLGRKAARLAQSMGRTTMRLSMLYEVKRRINKRIKRNDQRRRDNARLRAVQSPSISPLARAVEEQLPIPPMQMPPAGSVIQQTVPSDTIAPSTATMQTETVTMRDGSQLAFGKYGELPPVPMTPVPPDLLRCVSVKMVH